ncbi:MAG: glutamine-hydrolyzing GMP synthase [Anaerolineales bacterium]|jgi:GMP synthase (glutamine-hydrolysing)|nr:glutamine-hydrolyzing GMP synthase [Anaerolineales bacterium]HJO33901.1 glutamine-hydrolyzing GMP synthase [Anaerolineales bacterium]
MDSVAIIDFGSQYSQLIARRVREAHAYCELFPFDTTANVVLDLKPKALILSGGPSSVYAAGAPQLPPYVLEAGVPVLGICYGMQLLSRALGGEVKPAAEHEYGRSRLRCRPESSLLPDHLAGKTFHAWMSHGDLVAAAPANFSVTASSENCPIAAIENPERGIFGFQFHPEVHHTEHGSEILEHFLRHAHVRREWTPGFMVANAVKRIRAQVGEAEVISAVSGGVDSTVATALVHRAIGDRLTCFYVDTGLMRAGETEQVVSTFQEHLQVRLEAINAVEDFMTVLSGVTDPEVKRKAIGEEFMQLFEREARRLGSSAEYLVQGTIYPDVVESSGKGRQQAAKIKTHHNVGGLPDELPFTLIEPLRFMFKDEVRAVGAELGLPEAMVWRHPFPGPGLAIRCLGEVTWERLERLRLADSIMQSELAAADMLRGETAQAFAVLLPVKSVGVMGDARTYEQVVALRAVTTDDFMTADWARLPHEKLARISNRIINEVRGVNRVVYDISSKPPSTIEWE